ncbi:chemotaxis protein CheB [bacterium]|nr:MAG: chemotaxis protein CheB [bacterium]
MRTGPANVVVMVAPPEAVTILRAVLAHFPPDFPAAVVILMHAGDGHERPVANNLNSSSSLMVMPAMDGTQLRDGYATVVFPHQNLTLGPGGSFGPQHGTETLLMSLAARYRERAVAVALTALGTRETQDFRSVREVGGHTIALDEADFLWTSPAGPRVVPNEGDEVVLANMIVKRVSEILAIAPVTA